MINQINGNFEESIDSNKIRTFNIFFIRIRVIINDSKDSDISDVYLSLI